MDDKPWTVRGERMYEMLEQIARGELWVVHIPRTTIVPPTMAISGPVCAIPQTAYDEWEKIILAGGRESIWIRR